MPSYKITRNPYGGGSSKIIETDVPDEMVSEILAGRNPRKEGGVWKCQANKGEEARIDAALQRACIEIQRRNDAAVSTNVVSLREPARRVVVEAGKRRVGDIIGGRIIARLGREWRIDSEETSAHGIGPWVEWVQYAYFD